MKDEILNNTERRELPIGPEEVAEAAAILQKYKAGKAALDKRLVDNELWFRMGHWKNYQNPMMEGKPMFQVFNTCKHFIRTIPNLVYDESNVEDIDTRQEDHIYDECRYVLMEKPISPPRRTVRPPQPDDPLELHQRARFYRI